MDKSKGKTDKNKKVMPYQPKPKHNPLKRKENPNKDQTCHHCHVAGHWKRNCPLYLEELQKIRTRLSMVLQLQTLMQKLQREGLLESINDESFDKCESCISGKMTKKPFNNNIERATDLLDLIHTDVRGPLRNVSRKGASYFLTFTDDFSRYGYVYLLKHKHEDYALESAVHILDMVPTKKIRGILYSSKASILVNGSPTKEFSCYRGLKQGDSLAPYLFILVVESLHLSFSHVVEEDLFKGIQLPRSIFISHLFYADDAMFIGEWSDNNLKGVMVGDNMSRLKAWDDIILKIKSRLSKWKVKTLSIGGRLTLLKSVLDASPIYAMSIFTIPHGVLKALESILNRFFNGADQSDHKIT
nr:hypothetical protein [Tanacetum cinerariifolium]